MSRGPGAVDPTTHVRVDAAALRRNCREVRAALHPEAKLCAVVKANAYGHGLVPAARLFAEAGCALLGVASVEEGLQLRQAGLGTPILVFHPPTEEEAAEAVAHRLTLSLSDPEHLRFVAQAARRQGVSADYHLEVDVGLGRSGWVRDPRELLQTARETMGSPPGGIWAHLGPRMVPGTLPAEAPSSWRAAGDTPARLAYLEAMRQELRDKPDLSLAFHVAASAVLCDQPRLHWDLARIGCLLYGVIPSFAQRRGLRVQSAIELRTRIVALRTLPREAAIGYGAEFRTARETRLATLPVGLSHGVALLPESSVNLATGVRRLLVRYAGSRGRAYRAPLARLDAGEAPLVGRVSLNECTVDVTDLPGVSLGDEVSVPARMTTLNPSLPRVYVEAQD